MNVLHHVHLKNLHRSNVLIFYFFYVNFSLFEKLQIIKNHVRYQKLRKHTFLECWFYCSTGVVKCWISWSKNLVYVIFQIMLIHKNNSFETRKKRIRDRVISKDGFYWWMPICLFIKKFRLISKVTVQNEMTNWMMSSEPSFDIAPSKKERNC